MSYSNATQKLGLVCCSRWQEYSAIVKKPWQLQLIYLQNNFCLCTFLVWSSFDVQILLLLFSSRVYFYSVLHVNLSSEHFRQLFLICCCCGVMQAVAGSHEDRRRLLANAWRCVSGRQSCTSESAVLLETLLLWHNSFFLLLHASLYSMLVICCLVTITADRACVFRKPSVYWYSILHSLQTHGRATFSCYHFSVKQHTDHKYLLFFSQFDVTNTNVICLCNKFWAGDFLVTYMSTIHTVVLIIVLLSDIMF